MAAWLHGCMAAWLHGCMAAWLHGCMAAWLHGWCQFLTVSWADKSFQTSEHKDVILFCRRFLILFLHRSPR